jgi:hypothetical protein
MQGSELLQQITILDAKYWLRNTWSEVERSTIVTFLVKSGLSFDSDFTNRFGSVLFVTGE